MGRAIIAILLVLVGLTSLVAGHSANAQLANPSTSYYTTTSLSTSTIIYSAKQVMSTTLVQTTTVPGAVTVTNKIAGNIKTAGGCGRTYRFGPIFRASPSLVVGISYTADGPTNMYLLNQDEFSAWYNPNNVNGVSCEPREFLIRFSEFTFYQTNFQPTKDDTYYIFVSYKGNISPAFTIVVTNVINAAQVTTTTLTTFSTLDQPTTTIVTRANTATGSVVTGPQDETSLVALVALFAAIAVAAAVVLIRRLKKTTP